MAEDPLHPDPTRKSGYRYLFAGKHHGGGARSDARWLVEVTQAEEFSIFDTADFLDIADERGWLYGVLATTDENLRDLGTWEQQVAEFPLSDEGVPWHGYPLWAVNRAGPANRSGQQMRPTKLVFDKMEQAGLITSRQRKRLYKGDHA